MTAEEAIDKAWRIAANANLPDGALLALASLAAARVFLEVGREVAAVLTTRKEG